MTRRSLRRRRTGDDEGASLVEFALVFPILALFLFGIIEFGWAFSQHLDVRHGAREGARLAAVDFKLGPDSGGTQDIIQETCRRMSATGDTVIELGMTSGSGEIGDVAFVEVRRPFNPLTGFLDFAVGGLQLTSTVEMRLERPRTWSAGSGTC